MQCFFCSNAWAHPATGAVYGQVLSCASCVRELWEMVFQRMHGKPRMRARPYFDFVDPFITRVRGYGPSFYDHIVSVPTARDDGLGPTVLDMESVESSILSSRTEE